MEPINVGKKFEQILKEEFEQILKEEAEEISIDWSLVESLVEIKWVLYEELLLTHLMPPLAEYMAKMVVLGFEGKIPVQDVDNWFRSYRFTYCIYYKTAHTATEKMEMLSLGAEGTISDIAIRLRDIFRDFKGVLPSEIRATV